MASKDITTHELNGGLVIQRESDGYFNGTSMCSSVGKKIYDYMRLSTSKDYLEALSIETGIPVSKLTDVVKGRNKAQGTWIHPKVAIHLAQWLSPEYAVKVTNLVIDWMSGVARSVPALPPKRRILKAHLVLVWSDEQVETTDLSDESLNYALSHVRPESVVLSYNRVEKAMKPAQEGLAAGLSLWGDLGEMVQRRGVSA